jgi:hypothetical protein
MEEVGIEEVRRRRREAYERAVLGEGRVLEERREVVRGLGEGLGGAFDRLEQAFSGEGELGRVGLARMRELVREGKPLEFLRVAELALKYTQGLPARREGVRVERTERRTIEFRVSPGRELAPDVLEAMGGGGGGGG